MKLQDLIRVNTNYTRSINLERDANSSSIAKSYIPTSRTLSTLSRIGNSLNREDTLRALALIGPYGSGKSAFAVFLAHLLGPFDDEIANYAKQALRIDLVISARFQDQKMDISPSHIVFR